MLIIRLFIFSTLLSGALVVAKDAVVTADGASSSSSVGRPLKSFLRHHRELQVQGFICDSNSDNAGTGCENNKDCPPNKGSSQGKCISDGISPAPGPGPTSATCGYCEVDNSICSTDSDCPVSSGGSVCNSVTICTEGSEELCAGDTCLDNSDCLPNNGPGKRRGNCIQETTTTTCIVSSCSPSNSPVTSSPTLPGSTEKPILPNTYYEYTADTTKCDGGGANNIQGPAPLADKSNVALQLFAFGDTPYDHSCNTCNTCIENGQHVADCNLYDCTVGNSQISSLPIDNTCTYEGEDYNCLKDIILPWMQGQTEAGEADFSVHVGDIIKGNGDGGNRRCQDSSFTSRKNLFSGVSNFLVTPGDNDWNECEGYDITSPTDGIRSLWRQRFAEASSPFNSFNRNFASGSKPSIARRNTTPEIFYFTHNQVGVFGLNQPSGSSFEEGDGPTGDDLNAEWVAEQLADDTTCSLKSIVLVAHKTPSSDVNDALDAYFTTCGSILPTLTITGSSHPSTYCFNFDAGIVKRVDLTVEAFRSGPVRVSVVRDLNGEDYFHVSDADLADSNSNCPNFSSP